MPLASKPATGLWCRICFKVCMTSTQYYIRIWRDIHIYTNSYLPLSFTTVCARHDNRTEIQEKDIHFLKDMDAVVREFFFRPEEKLWL